MSKLSSTEKCIVGTIIVTFIAIFVIAFTLGTYDSDTAPKHGSYAKCDQYGVKGCVRWSVVTY